MLISYKNPLKVDTELTITLSKAKIVAMYFEFIVYVKVNCMRTVQQKKGGRNDDCTVGRFLLFIILSAMIFEASFRAG